MATSSITKEFVVQDEDAIKRFEEVMDKPAPPLKFDVNKNPVEEGRKLLKQLSSR